MSTIRISKRDNPFVQVVRKSIDDPRLSFKATGLLTYLLSKPDDWRIRIEQLSKAKRDGRDSVRSALVELKTCGYLVAEQGRDDGGKFGSVDYVLYESPILADSTGNGLSGDGLPGGGKTVNGKPNASNSIVSNNVNTSLQDDAETVVALLENARTTSNAQGAIVSAFEALFPSLDPPSYQNAFRLFKRMKALGSKGEVGPCERVVRALLHVRNFENPKTLSNPVELVFRMIDFEKTRRSQKKASSPGMESVEVYFEANGSDRETGRKFWRSFEARSWRLYGDPVTNWKPLADSWIERGERFDDAPRMVFIGKEAFTFFEKHKHQRGKTLTMDEMFEVEKSAEEGRPARFTLRESVKLKSDR